MDLAINKRTHLMQIVMMNHKRCRLTNLPVFCGTKKASTYSRHHHLRRCSLFKTTSCSIAIPIMDSIPKKNITTTPNLNDQPAKSNIDIVQTKNIFDGSITLINSTNTTFNMLSKSYFPKFSWVKHLQLRSFTFYKW